MISLCLTHVLKTNRALSAPLQAALDATFTKCVKAWHGCGRHFHLVEANGAFQVFLNCTYNTFSSIIRFFHLLCFLFLLFGSLFSFHAFIFRFYLFLDVVFLRLFILFFQIRLWGMLRELTWLINLLKSTFFTLRYCYPLVRLEKLRLYLLYWLERNEWLCSNHCILNSILYENSVLRNHLHRLRNRVLIEWQGIYHLHWSDLPCHLGLFVDRRVTTLSSVDESALNLCAVQVWVALSPLLCWFTITGCCGMAVAWRIPFIILHRMLLLASSVLIPALFAERANLGFDLPLVTRDNLQGLINTGRKNDVVEFACGITALFLVFA